MRSFAVGMIHLDLDRFVELVGRSGLVEAGPLAQAVEQWKRQAASGEIDDAEHCAAHLVRAGLVTPWQSQKLLEGRHRGFLLGPYKLLDHLGSGGMGNVYLAEHVLMQRRVAVKVLPHDRVADADQLARFQFEGQAIAAMDHPNIVRAYDLGSQGQIHYLVMEFIEGTDLQVLVERKGPLAAPMAADYILQAAAGLEYAHAIGLVHRDIKPANLLVDRQGTVKILDMGLAKFRADVRDVPAFEQDDEVLGTAEYLAPEQAINSLAVDPRADIYGLGCTLYFLLSGQPPFSGRSRGEVMAAHRHRAPQSLSVARPDAPAALAAICGKMMEKSPQRRYASAGEVIDALATWLASEPNAGRAGALVRTIRRGGGLPISSSLRDTDPKLHETVRIATPRGGAASAPSSPMLPPPQPTPPIVSPPRSATSAPIPRAVPSVLPPGGSSWPSAASRGKSRAGTLVSPPVLRAASASRATRLLMTALVSALVSATLVLALLAFGG